MGSLMFFITYKCNLKCTYCYGCEKHNVSMDLSTAFKAVDRMLETNDEINSFSFFGGEPLIEFEKIRLITDYISNESIKRGKKCKFGITTNGTIGDEQIYKFLAQNRFRVTLSIDGNEASQDTERRTSDGRSSFALIRPRLDYWALLQKKCRVLINMVITPNNLEHLYDSLKYLSSKGFRLFNPELDHYSEWNQSDFDRLEREFEKVTEFYLEQVKNKNMMGISSYSYGSYKYKIEDDSKEIVGCSAGGKRLVVSPEGRYYPCYRFVGFDNIRDFSIGDIESGVVEEKRKDIIRIMENSRDFSEVCAGCSIGRCRISCLAYYYMPPADIEWKACNISRILAKGNSEFFVKMKDYEIVNP